MKISQNSQENTCAIFFFLIKLQACNFIKKGALTQAFSCEVYWTPTPPPSLLSFVKVLFQIRYSWNFMTFLRIYLRTFWRKFFFKKSHPSLMTSSFWTLVSRNFSRKRVSIFCMLLCWSCLRVGVMSYRILHVTKLIPNIIASDVIMTSKRRHNW